MTASILTETKKLLGLEDDYTVFDTDVILHINTALARLTQLGIGPENGYMILDKTATWDAFLGSDLNLNPVKSYVFLRVKLLFDPPATSFLGTAMQQEVERQEWLLNVYREGRDWVPPVTPEEFPCSGEDLILDGGSA